MTQFSYRAQDSSGAESDGTVEAASLQEAKSSVEAMGLLPIEVYPSVAFGAPAPASPIPEAQNSSPSTTAEPAVYLPIVETLRLYAGWLLAWYCLVYAIGSYQYMKDLPFRIPYADSLFLSPLVLTFTFAAFLFLLLTNVYNWLGKGKFKAFVLTLFGIGVFMLYRINVQ